MKKWSAEEIQILKYCVSKGETRNIITKKLDRSLNAISGKMKCLGITLPKIEKVVKEKINYGKIYEDNLPEGIYLLEEYVNAITPILHMCEEEHEWLASPKNRAGCQKCSKRGIKQRTHEEYIALLPKDVQVLDTYITSKTKIRHKHTCGHIWSAIPNSIIHQGTSCPKCATHGFSAKRRGFVYLIEFSGLYKIGITDNMERRFQQFGLKPDLIFYREFEKGQEALDLEKKWLKNIKHLAYNSSLLRTGNTETFKFS